MFFHFFKLKRIPDPMPKANPLYCNVRAHKLNKVSSKGGYEEVESEKSRSVVWLSKWWYEQSTLKSYELSVIGVFRVSTAVYRRKP